MTLRFDLERPRIRRWIARLALANIFFMLGTAAFLAAWFRLPDLSPRAGNLVRYVLAQFHLGGENLIASWYSSMLLLAVALASAAAFAVDRAAHSSIRDRTLSTGWLLFAATFALLSFDEMASFHERVGMIAAVNPLGGGRIGWVYVLAPPILAVGLFTLMFVWLHVRRVPAAALLLAVGVGLFLSAPLLERLELRLVRDGAQTTWAGLAVYSVVVVAEEGVAELFGALSFLTGVLIYAGAGLRAGPLIVRISRRAPVYAIGATFAAGLVAAHWIAGRLPAADRGIPADWFPAAGAALVAAAAIGKRAALPADRNRSRSRLLAFAIVCAIASAFFGAAIPWYATWHRFEIVRHLLAAALAVSFSGLCLSMAVSNDEVGRLEMRAGGVCMAAALAAPPPYSMFIATCALGLTAGALLPASAPLAVQPGGVRHRAGATPA